MCEKYFLTQKVARKIFLDTNNNFIYKKTTTFHQKFKSSSLKINDNDWWLSKKCKKKLCNQIYKNRNANLTLLLN